MTTEAERELRTSPEIGGMGHSVKRKEDPRFIRGARRVHRRRQPARPALARHRPQPVCARHDQGHRRDRGAQDPGRRSPSSPARTSRRPAPLDADARGRQADGAADRHRHVPVPGGRGGRRDDQATSPPTASRRSSSTTSRCRSSSTRTRRWSRTRSSSGPDRGEDKANNHIWHWESGDRAATDAAMAAAEVRVSEDIYIPRIHVASIETCGCVADWDAVRGQLTLHMTSQAPHAIRTVLALRRRPARAEHPGQDPRHRRRLRRQGAGLPGLRARGRRLA